MSQFWWGLIAGVVCLQILRWRRPFPSRCFIFAYLLIGLIEGFADFDKFVELNQSLEIVARFTGFGQGLETLLARQNVGFDQES